MRIKLTMIVFLLTLHGCFFSGKDSTEAPYSDHFVVTYVYINSMQPRITTTDCNVEDETILNLFTELYDESGKSDFQNSSEEITEELSQKYGDMDYPSNVYFTRCPVYPVKNVSITCQNNYNSSHLAGTSLNDCFTIAYYDAYKYITNGYNFDGGEEVGLDFGDWSKFNNITSLENFNQSSHPLLDPSSLRLYFETLPEIAGDYTFTITYTDESNTTYTGTIGPIQLNSK